MRRGMLMLESVFWKIFVNTGYIDAYIAYRFSKFSDDDGPESSEPGIESGNVRAT